MDSRLVIAVCENLQQFELVGLAMSCFALSLNSHRGQIDYS